MQENVNLLQKIQKANKFSISIDKQTNVQYNKNTKQMFVRK